MIRPLCRRLAATCLIWMTLVFDVRAESISIPPVEIAYPELNETSETTATIEVTESPGESNQSTMLPWPGDWKDVLSILAEQSVLPLIKEDGTFVWSMNGVECQCICPPGPTNPTDPTGPTTPTPSEHAPEPSSLILLGLGTIGASIVARRWKK